MGQLRTKMQKTGEIISRADGYGGFTKSDSYTGEQAGAAEGDESEFLGDTTDFGQQAQSDQKYVDGYQAPDQNNGFGAHQQTVQQNFDPQQVQQQGGAVPEAQMQDQIQYEPVQDHGMQHIPYTHNMMGNQGPQYPGMHMEGMMPYGNINGGMGM
ncbi:hypothetical protein CERZMDRAFT_89539 [Cercospora zeae-maydis SCOH1-5]|uniref:Uncharacterized protein n=1 Tax=Cercospora zeae-maydis SCOH1-5 TaxID=717836 RepID=A0A6A6FW73_9PEZI|nr:hypothetical protein CERZMDRAFT_89539 [Cercospora zeae-maydis SCOH1-5]